jgi:hypothetical protein
MVGSGWMVLYIDGWLIDGLTTGLTEGGMMMSRDVDR